MPSDIQRFYEKNRNIVLFCLTDPFEVETGYNLRVLQTIKSLKNYKLHVISFNEPGAEIASIIEPHILNSNKDLVKYRLNKEKFSFIKLLKGYGYSANQAFFSKENIKVVDEILKKSDPVCVIMEGFYFFNFLKSSSMKGIPVIMNLSNYEVNRLISTLHFSLSPKKKLLIILGLIDYLYSQYRFRKLIERYWIPTKEEKAKLNRFFRIEFKKIDVIPNSVIEDNLFPEGRLLEYSRSKTLLFAGNYSYPPNEEAARIIVNDLMPKIRRYNKIIMCYLAGPNPPGWLKELRDDNLKVTGYVQDLSYYYKDSCLFIAPIIHGGGTKYKVINALLHGLPVVGTSEALSGIDTSSTKYFKPVELKDFPQKIIELMENWELHENWTQEANKLIKDQFSFNKMKLLINNSIQLAISRS